MISESTFKTEQGKIFMKRLCCHFARQVPVVIVGLQGRIELTSGVCRIRVSDQQMHFQIDAHDVRNIEGAERTIAGQLLRISRQDELDLNWVRHTGYCPQR